LTKGFYFYIFTYDLNLKLNIMKVKKIVLLLIVALGLTTLMSTKCEKDDPEDPNICNGIVSAIATGNIDQTFCFDNLSTYTYEPSNYITLWARETSTDVGFDIKISAVNNQAVTPGTYNCGSGEPGFVEFIIEDEGSADSDFYKSQSGTITLTQASESTFSATFNVVAVGYYNEKSVNFSGTVDFSGIVK